MDFTKKQHNTCTGCRALIREDGKLQCSLLIPSQEQICGDETILIPLAPCVKPTNIPDMIKVRMQFYKDRKKK